MESLEVVGVVGSRRFKDYPFLSKTLNTLREWVFGDFIVVSGGASGADTMAWRWAVDEMGIPPITYPAYWDDLSHPDAVIKRRKDGTLYDALAGFRRNQEIVSAADRVIVAFWDGWSPGTKNTVELAVTAGLAVYVFWPGKESVVLDAATSGIKQKDQDVRKKKRKGPRRHV